jgi:hypothetical protein
MKMLTNGIYAPNNYVCIDTHWRERLMSAFCQCDDWSWLLKNSSDTNKTQKTSQRFDNEQNKTENNMKDMNVVRPKSANGTAYTGTFFFI